MLFIIIYLLAGFFFGLMGAGLARERSRDAAAWFIICFLFPFLGLVALIIGGSPSTATPEIPKTRRRKRHGAPDPELALTKEDEEELERVKWLLSQGIIPK